VKGLAVLIERRALNTVPQEGFDRLKDISEDSLEGVALSSQISRYLRAEAEIRAWRLG
jgi:hypothetical protein